MTVLDIWCASFVVVSGTILKKRIKSFLGKQKLWSACCYHLTTCFLICTDALLGGLICRFNK